MDKVIYVGENFGGYSAAFNSFPIIFFIVFSIAIGGFVFSVIKGISQWSCNNKQPILDVDCKVVSKRIDVIHHAGGTDANGIHFSGSDSTTYYVSFEFESKDRLELRVSGKDYGMICEGDIGKLKLQGTRFLEFNIR